MVLQLATCIGRVSLHADLAQITAHTNLAYSKQFITFCFSVAYALQRSTCTRHNGICLQIYGSLQARQQTLLQTPAPPDYQQQRSHSALDTLQYLQMCINRPM